MVAGPCGGGSLTRHWQSNASPLQSKWAWAFSPVEKVTSGIPESCAAYDFLLHKVSTKNMVTRIEGVIVSVVRSVKRFLEKKGTIHVRILRRDDHFFPGPTDIAWDLAGAIVEWSLGAEATEFLLASFHRLTGEDPRPRIPVFSLAYTVFRLAYCKMARTTVLESADELLLQRAIGKYCAQARRLLCALQHRSTQPTLPGLRIPDLSAAD